MVRKDIVIITVPVIGILLIDSVNFKALDSASDLQDFEKIFEIQFK
jgi:hypothetical protein